MKKITYAFALLAAFLLGTRGASADPVTPYTQNFDKAIETADHSFKVGTSWGHVVDSYNDDSYGSLGYYVTYTWSSKSGRNGTGGLTVGDQTQVGDGWATGTTHDLLVTPKVTGTSSIYVKKTKTSGKVSFYTVTQVGSSLKRGDLINVNVPTLSTDTWTKVDIPAQTDAWIGIYGSNVTFDDFEAESADINYQRGLTIKSVTDKNPYNIDCNADGKFPFQCQVILQNTGDYDLNPGDEGFSLSVYNYRDTTTPVFTFPLTDAIAVGASDTVLVSGLIDYATNSDRTRYDVYENITNTKGQSGVWVQATPYAPVLTLRNDDGKMSVGDQISYGLVNAPVSKAFTIRDDGAASLNVTAITAPEGFAIDLATPFTLQAHKDTVFNVTLTAVAPGDFSGDVVVSAEGVDNFTFGVSGQVLDPNKFFANFEDQKLPVGSYTESGWEIKQRDYSSSENAYMLVNSTQNTDNKFVTPLLTVGEGEQFSVDVARTNYYSVGDGVYLNVYYSSDRKNWTLAKHIPADSLSGERAISYTYFMGKLKTFVIDNIPAGNWYIGFGAGYTSIDNLYGFTKATIAHDWMLNGTALPTSAVTNNVYTATTRLNNLNTKVEKAGSYKARLYVDGKKVAESDGVALEGGAETAYSLSFVPHETGTFPAYIEVKNDSDGYAVVSDTVNLIVAAETASASVQVGTQTRTDNKAPIYYYYADNSKGGIDDIIYSPDMLKNFGVKAGQTITSISFTGRTYSNKEIPQLTLEAYVGTADTATFEAGVDYNKLQKVVIYDKAAVSFVNGDDVPTIITLPTPIVWDGTSALRLYTYVNGNGKYASVSYPVDNNYPNATYYKSGTASTFYKASAIPVITLGIETSPTVVSGVVTCDTVKVAGAKVTLKNGEVYYTATTDAEGAYSVEVVQSDKPYQLTVTADKYEDYVAADSLTLTGDTTVNVSLTHKTVTISGTVTDGTDAIAEAVVTLTNAKESKSATTDANGAFSFTLPLSDVHYALTATAPYYESFVATDSLSAADDSVLAITLARKQVTISGTVSDGTSTVSGVVVTLTNGDDALTATSDATGVYSITLPQSAKKYALTATAEGYEDYVATDSVSALDSQVKDIQLVKRVITVTIPATGWTTFSSKYAIDFSLTAGLKAYIVSEVEGDHVRLSEVTAVPGYTGVLLQGAGDYTLTIVDNAEPAVGNYLENTADAALTVDASHAGHAYVLGEQGGKTGFVKANDGDEIPQGKAYIDLYIANAPAFLLLEDPTAIETIITDGLDENAPMFNLSGQRVTKSYRGVVLQNGRKFVKK